MTDNPPEPIAHPWLAPADVQGWLQLDSDADQGQLELARRGAASYVEDVRRGLFAPVLDDDGEPTEDLAPAGKLPDRVLLGAILAAGRLYARRTSPAGLASFAEFGAAEVLRYDPDVDRLLGLGRHAKPVAR